MAKTLTTLFAAAATALTLLAAPAAAQSVASQKSLLVQCKEELDLRGQLGVTERRVKGRTLVRAVILPPKRGQFLGGYISATDVVAINDCADRKSRRVLSTRDGYPLYASSRSCPNPAPILYRGNLYCFRGR